MNAASQLLSSSDLLGSAGVRLRPPEVIVQCQHGGWVPIRRLGLFWVKAAAEAAVESTAFKRAFLRVICYGKSACLRSGSMTNTVALCERLEFSEWASTKRKRTCQLVRLESGW